MDNAAYGEFECYPLSTEYQTSRGLSPARSPAGDQWSRPARSPARGRESSPAHSPTRGLWASPAQSPARGQWASPAQSPALGRKASPSNMAQGESYDIPVPLQNIGCQDLLQENTCSHCGWLRKRRTVLSQLLSWPITYVVLHKGCLYYFKTDNAKSSAGRFSFYGYSAVYRASEIPRTQAPWSFKIVHSHAEFKTYYFAAGSEKEMKVWMSFIKKELIYANGGSSLYGSKSCSEDSSVAAYQLKEAKEKEALDESLEDSSFYQDIETNIYDGVNKFVLSKDYQKQCSIKKQHEESDDEDLIDKRPPMPIPDDRAPFSFDPTTTNIPPPAHDFASLTTSRGTAKEPMTPPTPPSRPAKPRLVSEQATSPTDNSVKSLAVNLQKVIGPPEKSPRLRRKQESLIKPTPPLGSYVPTDFETPTPSSPDRKVDFRQINSSCSGGGSTGEEDPVPDLEEYWASIHFDDDKDRAHDIINAIGEDGVYLVRPEGKGTGKVLVVFSEDKPKKYRIQTSPTGEYFLAQAGFHDKCLENLLCYYYEEDLPTVKTRLKVPYKLHSKYKNLHL